MFEVYIFSSIGGILIFLISCHCYKKKKRNKKYEKLMIDFERVSLNSEISLVMNNEDFEKSLIYEDK